MIVGVTSLIGGVGMRAAYLLIPVIPGRSACIHMHRPATLGAMYEDGPLSHFLCDGTSTRDSSQKVMTSFLSKLFSVYRF